MWVLVGQGQIRRQYSISKFVSFSERIEYGFVANGAK